MFSWDMGEQHGPGEAHLGLAEEVLQSGPYTAGREKVLAESNVSFQLGEPYTW